MTQKGTVVLKENGILTIQFKRGSACENCKGCSGQNTCLNIKMKGEADVGDDVVVSMPDGQVAKASLIAYGIPLVGLMLGLIIASAAGGGDLVTIGSGLVGLLAASAITYAADKKIKKNKQWSPELIEVIKSNRID